MAGPGRRGQDWRAVLRRDSHHVILRKLVDIDHRGAKDAEPRMRLAVRGVPKGALRTHSA